MLRQKISKKMIMIIVLMDIKLIVLVSFDIIVRLFCNPLKEILCLNLYGSLKHSADGRVKQHCEQLVYAESGLAVSNAIAHCCV